MRAPKGQIETMVDKRSAKRNLKYNIALIVLYFIAGIVFIPMTFYHLSGLFAFPSPPVPENKYGEFPFRIVYEIGDERFTIEDVLIIEYAGRNKESFTGREIKWIGRLESGDKMNRGYSHRKLDPGDEWKFGYGVVLLDRIAIGNGNIGPLEIDIGSAQYYLGYWDLGDYKPGGVCAGSQGNLDSDELWEQYEVRIIEATFSEPMVGNGL